MYKLLNMRTSKLKKILNFISELNLTEDLNCVTLSHIEEPNSKDSALLAKHSYLCKDFDSGFK